MEPRIDPSGDDKTRGLEERLDKLASDIKRLPPRRVAQLEKLLQTFDKKVVSIKEAAEILDVSIDTIRRSIKSGSLKAFQLNKRGAYRIPIEEIERFMKG